MMPSHFNSYVANFNRVRLSEMIDYHADQAKLRRIKPSLVVHPWTGKFYGNDAEQPASCSDDTAD